MGFYLGYILVNIVVYKNTQAKAFVLNGFELLALRSFLLLAVFRETKKLYI